MTAKTNSLYDIKPGQSLLLTYLEITRKRLGMYFGGSSLTLVDAHLQGWRAHKRLTKHKDDFADQFFEDFHGFVADHYQQSLGATGWCRFICAHENGEQAQLDTFFSLAADFAAQRDFILE